MKKNEKTPYEYAPKTPQVVWWKCKRGHIWKASIGNRTDKGHLCKECREIDRLSKTLVCYARPELIDIWDFEKNGENTPYNVTISQNIEIYWYCKKCRSSWKSNIRNKETNACPICTGHTLKKGVNDFKSWCLRNNKSILKMYSSKNEIGSSDITYSSGKEVIWECPKFHHTWKATINSVVSRSSTLDCNNCKKDDSCINQNNIPCGIAFHKRTMSKYVKKNVKYMEMMNWWSSENKINFLDLKYGDGGKTFLWTCPIGHTFKRTFEGMFDSCSCPICSKYSKVSFSELLLAYELKKCYPDLMQSVSNTYFEWLGKMSLDIYIPQYNIVIEYDGPKHVNKLDLDNKKNELCLNHGLKIIRLRFSNLKETKNSLNLVVKKGTNKEVCNLAFKIVEIINKEYSENKILNINIDSDEREVSKEFYNHLRKKSLGLLYPNLIKEFDIEKNGGLNPNFIPYSSNVKYWWTCSVCGNSWEQTPNARTSKGHEHKCPFCNNDRVKYGFNDITTIHPEVLIDWDYKNNDKLPTEIYFGSGYRAKWICHNCGHHWETLVKYRCLKHTKCPNCMCKFWE